MIEVEEVTGATGVVLVSAGQCGENVFYAIYSEGLTSITIPKNVKKLGNGAFWGSAIQSLTIPASVTEIGKYLCRYCIHLKTVRIESSLMGEYMFTNCSTLTSLTITTNVAKIGTCALTYCNSLTEITYTGTLSQWSSISKGNNWDGKSARTAIWSMTARKRSGTR